MYIVVLGAPGAGKGTQALVVARELKLAHIASGDLFRQAVERGDELGVRVRDYMVRGTLVPDEITIKMITQRVSAADCKNGAILDGFPRNLQQAKALEEDFKKKNRAIDRVLYIVVPEEELIRRLSGRRVCRDCQKPHQNQGLPLKAGDKCYHCGGELYQRPDDNAATVKKRLEVYFAETMPLIEYYRQQAKLVEVDGRGSVEEVTARILEAIERHESIKK